MLVGLLAGSLLISYCSFSSIIINHQKKMSGINLKKNLTITLNVLHAKKKKIYLVYVSKYNSNL